MKDGKALARGFRGVMAIVVGQVLMLGLSLPSFADDDERSYSRDYSYDRDRSGSGDSPKNTFNIMMNYELGMHCTGFEFAYCCVLPPYNSILAQVVKTQNSEKGEGAFARLLEGDPNNGLDALGRETVLRDPDLGPSGTPYAGKSQKYVLRYWHEAQPRDGSDPNYQGENPDRLISAVEGNSLFMWNTIYDAACANPDDDPSTPLNQGDCPTHDSDFPVGALVTGSYNGASDVVLGDGDYAGNNDSYANGWMNHLYIYADLEGTKGSNTLEENKIRLGVDLVVPTDCGPAFHPMGPTTQDGDPANPVVDNDCGGFSRGNVLTFSGKHGTIVYTQMKVLEDLPITLTSPRIWEALGLPLTPFEDSINFFADPGLVDEDSIRPYVAMKAQLHYFDTTKSDGVGAAVFANNQPVVGFGTAPIDIPNCERCHSNGPNAPNSPQKDNWPGDPIRTQDWKGEQWALVQQEKTYWDSLYGIDTAAGDSDWYSRLKSAAISMMYDHDMQHGTSFTAEYPATDLFEDVDPGNDPLDLPGSKKLFKQNTRLGHESVICQKCHADNVIAVVKSATGPEGLIPPVTEAIHRNHRGISEGGVIAFSDKLGRSGACQGCHPAHRSDGEMVEDLTKTDPDRYPISLIGDNAFSNSDNRLAAGGCFVGRDVHSNPFKDRDGAGTPAHLNPVGQWLSDNVFYNQDGAGDIDGRDTRGIWCTNCHSQLGQEIWKAENMEDLVRGIGLNNVREPFPGADLADVAAKIGVSEEQAIAWLDPTDGDLHGTGLGDFTHAIWKPDPGLCDYVSGYLGITPVNPDHDGNVATVEVNLNSNTACSTGAGTEEAVSCGGGVPDFYICGSKDGDGDFSVNILDFCTTPDCVTAAAAGLPSGSLAVPVPFSAATDGRDHWLAAGEPHCADCHAAPYVEPSGGIKDVSDFAPFNYPRKASLMRYSRGHRDITCQGCHESIHGLYPVTPPDFTSTGIPIDATTWAQAASMNSDGSHGPLNCSACHQVNSKGVHKRMDKLRYDGREVKEDVDRAISWAHTFTSDESPLDNMCRNCHEDERDEVSIREDEWMEHAMKGRASRLMMDQVEKELLGAVAGTNPDGTFNLSVSRDRVCQSCHENEWREVSCSGEDGREWKRHLSEGRVSQVVWEGVSKARTGGTCGW